VSGTMGNLLALMTHCRPSDEVFLNAEAHVIYYESGGLCSVAGVVPTVVPSDRGHPRPADLAAAIRGSNIHYPRPRLVWLENTHNRGAGSVMSLDHQRAVERVARDRGLAVHLDGARIFNAAAAQGVAAAELARTVDSAMIDLTKGLSCPLGALVAGSRPFIEEARFRRRILGGGMRQAGVIAACGLVAFSELIDRIPDDHVRAHELATRVAGIGGYRVDPASVETNMVYVDVSDLGSSTEVVAALREEGLLVSDRPPGRIRLVTHLWVDDTTVDTAVERMTRAADRLADRPTS